jgi:hypothetical protein
MSTGDRDPNAPELGLRTTSGGSSFPPFQNVTYTPNFSFPGGALALIGLLNEFPHADRICELYSECTCGRDATIRKILDLLK